MEEAERMDDEVTFEDFIDEEEGAEYKYEITNAGKDDDKRESPLTVGPGFHDVLEQQLGLRDLSDHEYKIGLYLIGCIDDDGYLRRDIDSIVDDIAFSQNIQTNVAEIEQVLKIIQNL